jgi:plastocyanin
LAAVAVTVAVVVGCGDDEDASGDNKATSASEATENPPMHARVEITKDGYKPRHLTILVGGTVTFVNVNKTRWNNAKTGDLPDVATDTNEFNTHTLTWEEPYKIYFHKPEKVTYFNALDSEMTGTVEAVPKVDTTP